MYIFTCESIMCTMFLVIKGCLECFTTCILDVYSILIICKALNQCMHVLLYLRNAKIDYFQ